MGQLWNIPGSEGGAPEASGSECEVEGTSWTAQEEPAVTEAGPCRATGIVSSPGRGAWRWDTGEASSLVKLAAPVRQGREKALHFLIIVTLLGSHTGLSTFHLICLFNR